jgi:hypothetical protein
MREGRFCTGDPDLLAVGELGKRNAAGADADDRERTLVRLMERPMIA